MFQFLNAKCESAFLAKRNPRQINWTVLYRRKHKKGQSVSILAYSVAHQFCANTQNTTIVVLRTGVKQLFSMTELVNLWLHYCKVLQLALAALLHINIKCTVWVDEHFDQIGCRWKVCMVSVCVMCCCWTVFCSLSSNAHSTPVAVQQQEIIVLAFDVFKDNLTSASLQTLQHV